VFQTEVVDLSKLTFYIINNFSYDGPFVNRPTLDILNLEF
jgi:hypothetical protein